jgi:hypothetical protein
MFYLSGFAVLPAAVMTIVSGELLPALGHSLEHPYVIPCIILFSVTGYVSGCLILVLIRHFDATLSEIVKSTRKVPLSSQSAIRFGAGRSLCLFVTPDVRLVMTAYS